MDTILPKNEGNPPIVFRIKTDIGIHEPQYIYINLLLWDNGSVTWEKIEQ